MVQIEHCKVCSENCGLQEYNESEDTLMQYDILNAEQLLNPQLVSYVRYQNPEVKFGYTCHAGFNFMHFHSMSKVS